MSSNRLLTASVLLVAIIAAVVSFIHIEHLAVTHGQTFTAAVLLPFSIDGTVAAASLAMLQAARAGLPIPALARTMLGLSVAATLAANVAYGASFGLTGALISGWPAVAFIGCAELAIGMVRRTRGRLAEVPLTHIAQSAEMAARIALAASIAVGNPLSQRQVMDRYGLSRSQEKEVRSAVLAGANGHNASTEEAAA
jgi:hypothetical protein